MTRRGPSHPLQPWPKVEYLNTVFNWNEKPLSDKREKSSSILEKVAQDNEWIRLNGLCRMYSEEARGMGETCSHCSGRGFTTNHPEPSRALCIAGSYENKFPIYLCVCARSRWPIDQLPTDVLRAQPLESWSI